MSFSSRYGGALLAACSALWIACGGARPDPNQALGSHTAEVAELERDSGAQQEVPPARNPVSDTLDQETAPPAGHAWVIFGTDTVRAEVAATADQRARGLMNRTDVPEGTGMLFVFEPEDVVERTFWMRETPVDLDVAFMAEGYRIFRIARMEANSSTLHSSGAPVFAALEVPGGWFDSHGIDEGDSAVVVLGPR